MLVKRSFLLFILCLLVIIGCSTRPEENEYSYSSSSRIKIFFSTSSDLNYELAKHIAEAETSIKGCFYSIKSQEVANALLKAYLRGVKVRLIMGNSRLFEGASYYPKLKNFGLAKRYTERSGLMHNKFCIIDEKLVWTGSYNPDNYATYKNNDAIVIESEELAVIYTREFEKLWEGKKTARSVAEKHKIKIDKETTVQVYFSPEDGKPILKKIIALLEKAESSIYFAHFTFTHPELASVLIRKAKEGVAVGGIMEYDAVSRYSKYDDLESMGVDVRKDRNYCFTFHHKFFIVDRKTVITGSLNPTRAAFKKNRENVLIIHSPQVAKKYFNYFKNLRKKWYRD